MRRQQGSAHFEYEDESRGMMIDYSDHQPYREGSATPVLDCEEGEEEEDDDELGYEAQTGKLKLTEVAVDDYSPHHSDAYEDDYDIQYESGTSIFVITLPYYFVHCLRRSKSLAPQHWLPCECGWNFVTYHGGGRLEST